MYVILTAVHMEPILLKYESINYLFMISKHF